MSPLTSPDLIVSHAFPLCCDMSSDSCESATAGDSTNINNNNGTSAAGYAAEAAIHKQMTSLKLALVGWWVPSPVKLMLARVWLLTFIDRFAKSIEGIWHIVIMTSKLVYLFWICNKYDRKEKLLSLTSISAKIQGAKMLNLYLLWKSKINKKGQSNAPIPLHKTTPLYWWYQY